MSGNEASDAVKYALQIGYKAIDSAQMYHNEAECGKTIEAFLDDKTSTPPAPLEKTFASPQSSPPTQATLLLASLLRSP
jgi:hypothetical protein